MLDTEFYRYWVQLHGQFLSDANLPDFFDLLFTKEELRQLIIRIELLKALLLGQESQRDIAARLCIGIATITRGSNALKQAKPETVARFRAILCHPEQVDEISDE